MSFPTNDGPSSLIAEGAQGSPCLSTLVFVFYFKLFILEPQPPCL